MASKKDLNTSDFELLYETEQGIWLAAKKNDYGSPKYIAQPLGILDGSDQDGADEAREQETVDKLAAFHDLMYNLNQGPAIAQLFNHENIISIVGHIKAHPVVGAVSAAEGPQPGRSRDYIVWDYCDAGNLSTLFNSRPYKSPDFYLPESLCWHVLTSLLSAMTHLHDGKRLFLDTTALPGEERQWLPVDQDWNPILHRAIEPRNIFFQHSRGSETYGLCKLGNFEHAVVTNHVITSSDWPEVTDEDVEMSTAMAPRRGLGSLDMTRDKLRKSAKANTADDGPYTVADELFSVGAVVFTMMTGRQLPDDGTSTMTQYSEGLRGVVGDLLDLHPGNKTRIANVLPRTKLVMERYREWKNGTAEGKLYKDIEDDMVPRYEAGMGKRRNGDGDD